MNLLIQSAVNRIRETHFAKCFLVLLLASIMPVNAGRAESENNLILLSEKTDVTAGTGGIEALSVSQLKYLKNLEDRFFFHSYDHDPSEKRIERLELLIFGGAQYGLVEERIEKLKKAIEEKDRKAALKMKEKTSEGADDGKAQYPILNTLEWRVLKKTYRDEGIDNRLDRLESKLFGKSSPAMSYADRIERLKKIVGISITSLPPRSEKILPGPLPRVQQDRRTIIIPFGNMQSMPNMPDMPNFNPNSEEFQEDFNRQMMKDLPNMMRYMNKQLRDIFENGPRSQPYSMPKSNDKSPAVVPNKKPKVEIPPYADPNSI